MNVLPIYGVIILVLGLVIWRRTKEMVHPIQGSGVKILLPVLYLSPVISVFSHLQWNLELWEMGVAALIGVLFAVPLMLTTNYEIRQDGQIYAQKNKLFFIALLAVLVIRIVLRQFFSGMDPSSLALLFYTVALGYVIPWRIASFVKFRKVKELQTLIKLTSPIKA
ncbi:cytochrome c biogenesis protein CcdC [Bacillus sp. JJ1609]|uniref:CcdC family protein n=1 Tax=Bacillus sp. JJ1609 TaxID=3122977 RepID=UPI002FFF279D